MPEAVLLTGKAVSEKAYEGDPPHPAMLSWRAGPLQPRLPVLGECPRARLLPCTSRRRSERLRSASVNV